MIELLLKSSLAIGIALLFYKTVLQQESFFATNRLYLLGCLVLAFALPFISLPKLVNQQGYLSSVITEKFSAEEVSKKTFSTPVEKSSLAEFPVISDPSEEITASPPEEAQQSLITETPKELQPTPLPQQTETFEESWIPVLSLQAWLMLLYFFGVVVLSLSLLFQIGCIFFEIFRSRDKIRDSDYIIVNTATRKAPCSFFKYIFIYPDDYDFEAYEQIIKHEKTHVRLGHSFDLLLAELAVIALWFNPLIWLFKKEIEKNNEYQTDSILVEKEEVRKDQYQLNLLQIAVPNKPLNITTNYNQSLIKKRIIMMNSKRSTPHAYWKYAFLVPLFLGMLLLINEPATGQETKEKPSAETEKQVTVPEQNRRENELMKKEDLLREPQLIVEERVNERQNNRVEERVANLEERQQNVQERIAARSAVVEKRQLSISERGAQTDMTRGAWYSSVKNGKYCIEFRGSSENSRWNMSDCFERSAFKKTGDDTFVMTREAGTLELKGNLDAEVGQGKYEFKESASFKNLLAKNNISDVNKNTMFHLFLGGMTSDYVNFLVREYPNVDGDDLTALAIHDVKQDQFKNFVNLFRKYSGENPQIDDIVGLKIHGVTEDYVQELQKMGFTNLSLDDIMGAKIHGISAAYAQDLRNAGFTNLSMDEIVTAKIHGVAPQTIKEMRALGAKDLDEIVELQIHNVNADYVKDLRASGLENLTLDEVVSAKIHGLNPSSMNEIKSLGFKNADFDDLLTARIHNIDAAFVKDLQAAGFSDLSMNTIVSAKIHGINREFIEKARKNGYDLNSIDKYISLKIHGSAMEALKDQN